MSNAAGLKLSKLEFGYDSRSVAVRGVDLELAAGSLFCLLGPSGCGKSTLLKLIGGHLKPAAGTVIIGERDVSALPPEDRDIGMVFQSYALFPHLTARANVRFGLEMRRLPEGEIERRTDGMLDRVGLDAEARDRLPRALSGGQQQRVALARALVIEPRLLLLDEPLANLDRRLREQMRVELRDLQRRLGVTTVLVTHDQEEALALADRVGLMMQGRLVQVDAPEALYARPRTAAAARFVGDADVFQIESVDDSHAVLALGGARLSVPRGSLTQARAGQRVLVRPESWHLGDVGSLPWTGEVVDRSFHGADLRIAVKLDVGLLIHAGIRAPSALAPGQRVGVGLPSSGLWTIPDEDAAEA